MNEIIEILTKTGAIMRGSHFVGTSELHFDTYLNKDFLYPHTKEISRIGKIFAEKYKDADIEVVVGPALGGIILSQWTAFHLSELSGREVLGIYTEKGENGEQTFTRGYENFVKGKRVLVVEDIVTTGGSLLKTLEAVKKAEGKIIKVCALVNKNKNINHELPDVPLEFLASFYIDTYEASKCPLCKEGVPINTTVGHGRKFLAKNKP